MKMRGFVICACLVVLPMLFPCSQTCGQWVQLGLDDANVGDLIVVGTHEMIFRAGNSPPGVYYLRLTTDEKIVMKKILLME